MNRRALLSTVFRREQYVDYPTFREMMAADILNAGFGDPRRFRPLGSGPQGYRMEYIDIPGATLVGPVWDRALRRSFEQTRELNGADADLVIIDDPFDTTDLRERHGMRVAMMEHFTADAYHTTAAAHARVLHSTVRGDNEPIPHDRHA